VVILILIASVGGILWQNRPLGWSRERQITQGSGDSRLVDLAADSSGHGLYLAWEDTRDNATQVYFKRSLNKGLTWEPDIRLSNLTTGTVEPEPRIATDGKTVLVFFANETATGEHIFFVSSTNAGADFAPPAQLTNDSGEQSNPAVAFVGSTVHFVYQDYFNNGDERIFYVKSPDAGLTWQHEVALTNTTNAEDHYPAIAAVDDNVFVTWCRDYESQEAIYVKVSLDSGANWKPEAQVSGYTPASFQEFPAIDSNGAHVYVVWNNHGLEYSHSSDYGRTWSGSVSLTNMTRQYLAPRLSVVNSQVQVVAAAISVIGSPRHIKIDSDVYYVSSSDAGETWIKPLSLTIHKFGTLSLAPVIWSHVGATFVAWEDNRNGRLSIFFLSKPDFAVLHDFEWQLFPAMAMAFIVVTALYLGTELRGLRTAGRRHEPRRRPQRKSRRRIRAKSIK
jgi:hypothetical protein